MLKSIFNLLFNRNPTVNPLISPRFKNESIRLKNEYNELIEKNVGLFDLINDLCIYAKNSLREDIVITMIYRTDEEQDSIYKDDPKYIAKKFKSPHQFYHAVDIRSHTFTADEIKNIEDYLNNKYNPNNYYKWTAKNHNVGLGDHFHIQYIKK
jgi:hypothetical protein